MLELREGWTERIRMLLSHDDLIANLTGATVTLVGEDGTGATVSIGSPKVGIEGGGTDGIVFFDPDSSDLLEAKSPYRLRVQVTIGGRSAFFPRMSEMVWVVSKP